MPSGASTGAHEAVELRDGGQDWGGKGVRARGRERARRARRGGARASTLPTSARVDERLIEVDGTPNKGRLGANAILGVSLATAKAAAADAGHVALPVPRRRRRPTTLPVPMMNVINGGAHADNSIDLQEFMVVPAGAPTLRGGAARSAPRSSTRCSALLHERGLSTAVGDEGGFAPDLGSTEEAIDAHPRGGRAGRPPRRGRDRARPRLDRVLRGRPRTASRAARRDGAGMADFYAGLADRYPLVSIEDGVAEDDWDAWRALTERLGDGLQLVGDDLFVTNVERLRRGIDERARQRDPDQGQPDRDADARRSTRSTWRAGNGYAAVMSHRSGETEDTTIADLAVATGVGQIKTGAPSRTDRVAKYNQLLRIEEELGARRRTTRAGARFRADAP